MNKLDDTSPMPYGKFEGRPLEAVPASYLLWLLANNWASLEVAEYIRENMNVLEKEIDEKQTHE